MGEAPATTGASWRRRPIANVTRKRPLPTCRSNMMKYLCWIYDAAESTLHAGLDMHIPWWPDDAQHEPEYGWVAANSNTLIRTYTSGQIKGYDLGKPGYDVTCDVKIKGKYYTIVRISRMFDSLTLANSSGIGWIAPAAHTKGYNDDNTGWRKITWKMG